MTTSEPEARDLARRVEASAPRVGAVRLVCIDGPAGAGKTTIAARLATALEPAYGVVPVVHGDDLYDGWDVVDGEADPVRAFTILGERVTAWLLDPWSHGVAGEHPVHDWHVGGWSERRVVPAAPVVLLEGVGLGGRAIRARASLAIWVDADPVVRRRRVVERDGSAVAGHLDVWAAREAAWFAADGTEAGADAHLRTT